MRSGSRVQHPSAGRRDGDHLLVHDAGRPGQEHSGLDAQHHPLAELARRVAVAVRRLVLAGAGAMRHELAPPRLAKARGDDRGAGRLAQIGDDGAGPGRSRAGLDGRRDGLQRPLELRRRHADGDGAAHVSVIAVNARAAVEQDGVAGSHRAVLRQERPERRPPAGPGDGREAELGAGRADRVLGRRRHLDLARAVGDNGEPGRHPEVRDAGGLGQELELGGALDHAKRSRDRGGVFQARAAAEGVHRSSREDPASGESDGPAPAQSGGDRRPKVAGVGNLVAHRPLPGPVEVGRRVGEQHDRPFGRHDEHRLLLLDAEPVSQVSQVAGRVVDVGAVAHERVEPPAGHPLSHPRDALAEFPRAIGAAALTVQRRGQTPSLHARGVEVSAQLLDLVAELGGVLEPELLSRREHLLLELDDQLLDLLGRHALVAALAAPAPPGDVRLRVEREELGDVGDALLDRLAA